MSAYDDFEEAAIYGVLGVMGGFLVFGLGVAVEHLWERGPLYLLILFAPLVAGLLVALTGKIRRLRAERKGDSE